MEILRSYAMQFVGLPYRWGGDDAVEGFDCSGLVIELLQSCGMFPHKKDTTAQGLYNRFIASADLGKKEFGALVFFGKSTARISHVGFMLDDFRMLEAGGGGSKTTSRQAAEAHNAFIRIRPISIRSDIVAILRLKYDFS